MLRMAMEWIKREASLRVFCDCYCQPTIRPNRGQIQSVHLICCSVFGATEAAHPRVPRYGRLLGVCPTLHELSASGPSCFPYYGQISKVLDKEGLKGRKIYGTHRYHTTLLCWMGISLTTLKMLN